MSCIAFDGRFLVSDSLQEHFGVSSCGPAKIMSKTTHCGRVAVFGVASAAVWRGVAKYMLESCTASHENCQPPEHLWKAVDDGLADVGMIVRRNGEINAYSLERGLWAHLVNGKMAHGAGWQWAMCRMLTAGDTALAAVRCVAENNYCVRGPFWVLDMIGDDEPVRTE